MGTQQHSAEKERVPLAWGDVAGQDAGLEGRSGRCEGERSLVAARGNPEKTIFGKDRHSLDRRGRVSLVVNGSTTLACCAGWLAGFLLLRNEYMGCVINVTDKQGTSQEYLFLPQVHIATDNARPDAIYNDLIYKKPRWSRLIARY
jgi:hypothetical protein